MDEIIVTKWIALGAMSRAMEIKGEEISKRFPPLFVEQVRSLERCSEGGCVKEIAGGFRASYMREMGSGGILSALWVMAEKMDSGLVCDLRKIPVRQETIEILEYCNINPYYADSAGACLIVSDEAGGICAAFADAGIPCAVIGYLNDSKARIIRNGETVRYLDRVR
ncbi:MAG TPA: AIR synthase-related protein [Lachnospiraceae bacterium]|nr:AIR synthase-related protein [Lachnospiraceae bacterium]